MIYAGIALKVSIHVHPCHQLQQTTKEVSMPKYNLEKQKWAISFSIKSMRRQVYNFLTVKHHKPQFWNILCHINLKSSSDKVKRISVLASNFRLKLYIFFFFSCLPFQLPEKHQKALTFITYIGLGISLLGETITIVAYMLLL